MAKWIDGRIFFCNGVSVRTITGVSVRSVNSVSVWMINNLSVWMINDVSYWLTPVLICFLNHYVFPMYMIRRKNEWKKVVCVREKIFK